MRPIISSISAMPTWPERAGMRTVSPFGQRTRSESNRVKVPAFIFCIVGLLAGCKPQTLNIEQLMVENKLVEMAIDTLSHELETGDIRGVKKMLSNHGDFTIVYADTVEEANSPEAFLRLLESAKRSGYAISFGARRNLCILVSRSGDLSIASFDVLANVNVRDIVITVRLYLNVVMVRESGNWKLAHCVSASLGTTLGQDSIRR